MHGHPRRTGHSGDPDKTWSPGGGGGKPLQYFGCENPMNSIKRQKDMTERSGMLRYAPEKRQRQVPEAG